MSEVNSLASIGLSVIGKALNILRGQRKNDSLISFTESARVEPLMLVDQRIKDHDKAVDLANTMQTLFTGFYLQAVNMDGNSVESVKMMKTLDKFNPNRGGLNALANSRWLTATESYSDRLPSPINQTALEDFENGNGSRYAYERERVAMEASGGPDLGRELREQASLSVGRLVNVTLKAGDKSTTVPVMIRLSAQLVDPSRLVHILTTNALDDTSARDRKYGWMAGAKSFMGDIILANDLIERESERLRKDTDGLYSTIVSRRNRGFMASVLTGVPSVGVASALVMMSQDTADEIERELGNSLDNFKTRQKIFEFTSVMIIAVLDQSWNKVTFYYRGVDTTNTVDVRALSAPGKGGGGDVMDIIKAFSLGNAPRL